MRRNIVDIALELDDASIQYTVQLTPAQMVEFVRRCKTYNGHTNKDLVNLVTTFNKAVPPMRFNEGNPNNGQPHHRWRVGNEYSRVIYLDITKSYLDGRWTDKTWSDFRCLCRQVGNQAGADEGDVVQDEDASDRAAGFVFRWWWD